MQVVFMFVCDHFCLTDFLTAKCFDLSALTWLSILYKTHLIVNLEMQMNCFQMWCHEIDYRYLTLRKKKPTCNNVPLCYLPTFGAKSEKLKLTKFVQRSCKSEGNSLSWNTYTEWKGLESTFSHSSCLWILVLKTIYSKTGQCSQMFLHRLSQRWL